MRGEEKEGGLQDWLDPKASQTSVFCFWGRHLTRATPSWHLWSVWSAFSYPWNSLLKYESQSASTSENQYSSVTLQRFSSRENCAKACFCGILFWSTHAINYFPALLKTSKYIGLKTRKFLLELLMERSITQAFSLTIFLAHTWFLVVFGSLF